MIELRNIDKEYSSPKTGLTKALQGVSLKINRGDIFGIIGPSGAGKSTLIRCINLLEKPTSGNVLIEGNDLMQMSDQELRATRRKMGMIFQSYNLLYNRNVESNVGYPLELVGMKRAVIKEKVIELLDLVGLGDKRKAYPSELSGGQKQRVAIARAIATNPNILLSDEGTAALDTINSLSILNLLNDLNKRFNLTIILISHDLRVVRQICNRVAVLNSGRIIDVGPVEKFNFPDFSEKTFSA